MLPSLHLEPGVVVQKCHPTPGILDLGRFPCGIDDTAEAVAADLRSAGFESVPRPDVMAWKYRKLVTNAVGDVSALLRRATRPTSCARRSRAEGEAVLAAAGIPVVTPRRTTDGAATCSPAPRAETRGQLARPEPRPRPAHRGRLPSGEIVLLGRLHGVPTPACDLLQRTARRRSAG